MGILKRYKKSFAAKMTFILCLAVIIVFLVIYTLTIYSAVHDLKNKEAESNLAKVSLYSSRIEKTVSNVEINVVSHESSLKNHLHDKADIERILKDIILKDTAVVWSFVCIEPGYKGFGENGVMYEAVQIKSDSIVFRQRSQDYKFNTFPYYLVPTRTKKDYWTFPFNNTAGGQVTSFGHPLIDDEGNVFGVLGADIGLDILTSEFQEMNHAEDANSHIFVVSRSGRYLVHDDMEKIVNQTIYTDARENYSEDLEAMGKDMLNGNDSTVVIELQGKRNLISYSSIPRLGWGIVISKSYDDIYKKMEIGLALTTLVLFVLMMVVVYVIYIVVRKKTKPIHDFAKSAMKIAKGDFDTPVRRSTSGDEIQQLGDSLDNMRISLKDYMVRLKETTAARESIEKELYIAQSIQMGMLPKIFPSPPECCDVDVYAYLQPAKEVGGDLYDFILKDDKFYFVIGDVSGKGIPASLIMAITSCLFRAMLQSTDSPVEVVTNINNSVSQNNERNMFVTLIVGELNLKNGHLRFCNAGHDPMLLLEKGKTTPVEMAKNLPVGLIEQFPYQMNEMDLQPNEKLLLYTDGVAEAENPEKELYTIERLIEKAKFASMATSKELIECIRDDVKNFANGADQSDDITIMSVHYKPEGKMKKEIIFQNKMEEVPRIATFIDEIGEELNLDFATISGIQLAIEEAVVNVIEYAYPDNVDGKNSLAFTSEANRLIFILSDEGTPFDPTATVDPDITLAAEDRPIGGLGIMLVKKIMNEVTYQRIEGKNELTMKKEI